LREDRVPMPRASIAPTATTGEAALESRATDSVWRTAWMELEARLSLPVLEAMLDGIESADPRLVQGVTHLPPLSLAPADAAPACGCLVGYGLWIGEGLRSIGEIDERVRQINRAVTNMPAVMGRVIDAWDGASSIDAARQLFRPVVRAALERRAGAEEGRVAA
jgi:hypothetical protein